MSLAISRPPPDERAYTTTFVSLDASLSGAEALVQMRSDHAQASSHVIVRWRKSNETCFYLLASAWTFHRLSDQSQEARDTRTLVQLLDLNELGQSRTIGEHEGPVPGAVVVQDSEVLGFFPSIGSDEVPAPSSDELLVGQPGVFLDSGAELDKWVGRVHSDDKDGKAHEAPLIHESPWADMSSRAPTPAPRGAGGPPYFGRETGRPRNRFRPNVAGSPDESDVAGTGHVSGLGKTSSPPPFEEGVRSGKRSPIVETSDSGVEREELPPTSRPEPVPPRYFNAWTPDRVALNAQTYVIVQVACEPVPTMDGSSTAAAPIHDFIGELIVDIHAPGLKATGPTTLTLQVPTVGDSTRLRFGFVALRVGIHQIDVMAWNGSAQVAGVSLHVAVETKTVTPGANQALGDLNMREPEKGEYTLDVAMDEETRRYRFQLRSDQKDVWPPMWSEPLLNDRQRVYEATLANLNAQARNLFGLKPKDQESWIRGLGGLLFEQLVPDKLQALLIERKSEIRLLNILSEADPTPWELLFLLDPVSGKGDFLCESATVARWRYGNAPSRSLKNSDNVLVLPADAPSQAQIELQDLRSVLGGANTIDDLSALNDLVYEGGFDILHFAAHNVNVPEALGGAYVPFGKQRWDITFLGGVPPNSYKSRKPLVFMNACTTSGTTAMYTELSSWADRFLKCGSGAFIGTLWEVRDESARIFSLAFYEQLMQGQTLGKSMQVARAKLRSAKPGDPTPFAYTLYGNPLARLEV